MKARTIAKSPTTTFWILDCRKETPVILDASTWLSTGFRLPIVGLETEESSPKFLVHTFDSLNPKSKTCGARGRSIINVESSRARSLFPGYLGNQIRQTYKPHGQAAVRSGEGALDVIGNHQVVALWVGSPERLQVAGVEI